MYAKYLNETAVEYFCGKILRTGGVTVANPTPAQLIRSGYKPLEETPVPPGKNGTLLLRRYRDLDDKIEVYYKEIKAGGETV